MWLMLLMLMVCVSDLDGHAGAVETKGEDGTLLEQALETCGELGLCDREAVSEMETAVHVGIRKGCHELGLEFLSLGGRIPLVHVALFPELLDLLLAASEIVALGGRNGLLRLLWGHCGRGRRRRRRRRRRRGGLSLWCRCGRFLAFGHREVEEAVAVVVAVVVERCLWCPGKETCVRGEGSGAAKRRCCC